MENFEKISIIVDLKSIEEKQIYASRKPWFIRSTGWWQATSPLLFWLISPFSKVFEQ